MIKFQEKIKLGFVLVSLNFQNTLGRGNIFNIIKSFLCIVKSYVSSNLDFLIFMNFFINFYVAFSFLLTYIKFV